MRRREPGSGTTVALVPAPLRFVSFIALAITLVVAPSCYSTSRLPPPAFGGLRSGGDHPRELVIRAEGGTRVRVAPSTPVRLRVTDGRVTPWFSAKELGVGATHVVVRAARGAPLVLQWNEIVGIEINEFDLGLTVVGAAGGVALAMTALLVEAIVIAGIAAITAGHVQMSEVGIFRATLDSLVDAATQPRTRDDEPLIDGPRAGPLASAASATTVTPIDVQPLFSRAARRRDVVEFIAAVDFGVQSASASAAAPAAPFAGAVAVARLFNVVEIGGGFRARPVRIGGADANGDATAEAWRLRLSPFVRIGMNIDLDAGRRVALPIAIDIGSAMGVGEIVESRLVWGVRFRFGEHVQVGVHPFNPTRSAPDGPGDAPPVMYTSGVELGFTY